VLISKNGCEGILAEAGIVQCSPDQVVTTLGVSLARRSGPWAA